MPWKNDNASDIGPNGYLDELDRYGALPYTLIQEDADDRDLIGWWVRLKRWVLRKEPRPATRLQCVELEVEVVHPHEDSTLDLAHQALAQACRVRIKELLAAGARVPLPVGYVYDADGGIRRDRTRYKVHRPGPGP